MASPSPSPSPPPPLAQNSDHQNQPQSPPPNSRKSVQPTTKKTSPVPWTHQETINLIQAYQEKWYSLKKGQLKASQWEEVAITVAARCDYDEPSKTATQCRHKIEKLRKRYRADRLKPPLLNSWQYFDLMDNMERGPFPISAARPVAMPIAQYNNHNVSNRTNSSTSDSDLDYTSNSNIGSKKNRSKSVNHIVRGGNSIVNNNVERSARVLRISRTPILGKRKEFFENDDDDEEEDEEKVEDDDHDDGEGQGEGRGSEMVAALAVEIRAFAERLVNMEHKKIEMMRHSARYRMEMENKRMEMVLESQKKLVNTICKAFSNSHKKMKMVQ